MSSTEQRYRAMLKAAKAQGREITDHLMRDLRHMAEIDDAKIKEVTRAARVRELADAFKVPVAAMEVRISDLEGEWND